MVVPCILWDPSSLTRDWTWVFSCQNVLSTNHWTTREFPKPLFKKKNCTIISVLNLLVIELFDIIPHFLNSLSYFLIIYFVEVQFTYNVMIISAVQQSDAAKLIYVTFSVYASEPGSLTPRQSAADPVSLGLRFDSPKAPLHPSAVVLRPAHMPRLSSRRKVLSFPSQAAIGSDPCPQGESVDSPSLRRLSIYSRPQPPTPPQERREKIWG